MEKVFTLTRAEIEEALEEDPIFPNFKNLNWPEDEQRLHFTTNIGVDGETKIANWSIDLLGEDLRRED